TNLAMYFVFADTLLMTQYLYYLNVRRKRLARRSGFFISLPTSPSSTDLLRHRHAASPSAEVETETSPLLTPTETRRNAGSSGTFFGVALFAFTAFANNVGVRSSSSAVVPPSTVYSMESGGSGMTLETAPTLSQTIGLFVAYTCTTLYLCSRLPQIYHTFCRRSTQGLSMSMFVCAAMGNLTYVLSILCNSTEFDHVVAAAPYLLGSGGTLGFDLLIFVQFLWYRRRGNVGAQRAKRELVLPPPQAVLEVMRDERELSLDVEDQGEIGWGESTKGGSSDSLVFILAGGAGKPLPVFPFTQPDVFPHPPVRRDVDDRKPATTNSVKEESHHHLSKRSPSPGIKRSPSPIRRSPSPVGNGHRSPSASPKRVRSRSPAE
ncbi:hypothetical protein HKX48_002396, partial [Thoreauomyces humboldtii]